MSHIVDHGGPGRSVLPSLVAFKGGVKLDVHVF
jgi:hypothetical protein